MFQVKILLSHKFSIQFNLNISDFVNKVNCADAAIPDAFPTRNLVSKATLCRCVVVCHACILVVIVVIVCYHIVYANNYEILLGLKVRCTCDNNNMFSV